MEAYRISCPDCDMKAKLRLTESIALQTARSHASATGHRVTVRTVGTADDTLVTDEKTETDASQSSSTGDD